MTVSRVVPVRVSNPRKRRKANPKRKMSLKQKLAFGTKRQRAAAKVALRSKRLKAKANPKRRRVVRRVVAKKVRRRRANPAHLLTIGAVNPAPTTGRKTKRRVKKSMAKTKVRRRRRVAKANPTRRRRRNSVKVIVRRARRANPRRRSRKANPRRRHTVRLRNPDLFGHKVGATEMAKAIAGGLAGVAITKAVPNMLPAGLSSSSPFMNVAISAAVAVGAGMLVKSLMKGDPTLGDAVLFGGLMQAGSVALNSFLPSVGTVIGLQGLGNGMGDIVPGSFPIPMNPIMAGQRALPAPAVAAPGAHPAHSGVGAIYSPFGRAM